MHSIGSAHAEVRSRRRETSLASTTDRILLIIGHLNITSPRRADQAFKRIFEKVVSGYAVIQSDSLVSSQYAFGESSCSQQLRSGS